MRVANFAAMMAATGLAFGPGLANAEELLFTYSGGIDDFSFEMPSNPTPVIFSTGNYTTTSISNWSGDFPGTTEIQWNDGGFIDLLAPEEAPYAGSQVYGGTEQNPIFAPGVFFFNDDLCTCGTTLTVTAVPAPEPAAWMLTLTGLAGLGVAFRSRRRLTLIA